ncbi:MAG: YitT family protein [Roseburia sp.]|jgi:uncharacterized membrane-anchored protein YitT (DUF2179 family)|nr:YitT family protein [Roseburia sp.]
MEQRKAAAGIWNRWLWITAGAAVYSAGISLFLDPNNLAPGGVSGLAIILSYLTQVKTGTWFFLFNIPLVVIAFFKFGFKFIVSTFYAVAVISWFTNLFAATGALTRNPLLAALAGSALVAVGMGIIFKAGATTGGSDIIIKLLRNKFRHLKTGNLFLITDTLIVAISGLVFGDLDKALYAGIAVIVNAVVLDVVLYGRDEAKMVFVISDHAGSIAGAVLQELEVGVTYLHGEGAYTRTEKKVILCVIKKQQYPQLEEIVKRIDPAAFLIVSSAGEIYGEGYKDIYSEKI